MDATLVVATTAAILLGWALGLMVTRTDAVAQSAATPPSPLHLRYTTGAAQMYWVRDLQSAAGGDAGPEGGLTAAAQALYDETATTATEVTKLVRSPPFAQYYAKHGDRLKRREAAAQTRAIHGAVRHAVALAAVLIGTCVLPFAGSEPLAVHALRAAQEGYVVLPTASAAYAALSLVVAPTAACGAAVALAVVVMSVATVVAQPTVAALGAAALLGTLW